ncbi:MAG: hypothetical protein ACM36A_04160 [Bacteroidota bacterium]
MSEANPYRTPRANVDTGDEGPQLERVATGQKLVVYAFLVYIAAGALRALVSPMLVLLAIPALAMALIGVWRTGAGLGWHVAVRILLLVLMFVPLVNLIVLLVVSGRATRALRDAGYRVGLLGASKKA